MNVFDDITPKFQIMMSYRKIACEKMINYRVTSPSNLLSDYFLPGERFRTLVIICCFVFLRHESVHVSFFQIKTYV